jgi:hypothetical protein
MNALIAIFHSRAGAVIQWLVGMFIGWLTGEIAALGIEIPAVTYENLSLGLQAGGAFIVTFLVQWYQARQAKKLQSALPGTVQDSWIGNQTIANVQALVDLATRSLIAKTKP